MTQKQFKGKLFRNYHHAADRFAADSRRFYSDRYIWHNSIVGELTEWLFKQFDYFYLVRGSVASTVVAFPLMYQAAKNWIFKYR